MAPTPPPIREALVRKATSALLTHLHNEAAKNKGQLIDDDDHFHLVVALKKVSEKASNMPIRIEIPNPLYEAETAEVCLFVKDYKGEGHKAAKERVKSMENCGVAKVLGISKLKANHGTFEAKRKLCDSYDLFMADDRIIPSLPKLIGKTFFKKRKQPVPVNLTRRDWVAQIKKALHATHTFITEGSCMNVKVAKSSFSEDEVVENVMAVLAALENVVPGKKWKNIQALYLKTNNSVALPIFNSLPEAQKIDAGTGKGKIAEIAA